MLYRIFPFLFFLFYLIYLSINSDGSTAGGYRLVYRQQTGCNRGLSCGNTRIRHYVTLRNNLDSQMYVTPCKFSLELLPVNLNTLLSQLPLSIISSDRESVSLGAWCSLRGWVPKCAPICPLGMTSGSIPTLSSIRRAVMNSSSKLNEMV